MIIDLFGFLPLDVFLQAQGFKSKNYNKLIRLLRLPRLYRLLKLKRIIKYFKSKQGGNKCMEQFVEKITIKESASKLLSFFITVMICTHLMTCLFYFAAKYYDFSPKT